MKEDPAQRERIRQLRQLWEMSEERPRHAWDIDSAWEEVSQRADLLKETGPAPKPRPVDRGPAVRDRGAARRRMGGRSPSRLGRALRYAAVIVAVGIAAVAATELQYDFIPEEKVFITKRGQKATIELADGTQVRLNADSRLTLEAGFGTSRRAVELQGEAYFEVAKDPSRPFRVQAGPALVEVMGTAFDVRAYHEEAQVRTAVAEGKVSMWSKHGALHEAIVLQPRQAGILEEDAQAVRRSVAPGRYLAWTEDSLVFEAAPFDEVAAELERWYDLTVELTVPPEQVDRLYASFHDEPLKEVLGVVAAALHLKYKRDGSRATFYPARPDRL